MAYNALGGFERAGSPLRASSPLRATAPPSTMGELLTGSAEEDLDRRNWSGKVINRARNTSPGMGVVLQRSDTTEALGHTSAAASARHSLKRQPREGALMQTVSFSVETLMNGTCQNMPGDAKAVRRRSPQITDSQGTDRHARERVLASEGVKVALADAEVPAVSAQPAAEVVAPIAPWGSEEAAPLAATTAAPAATIAKTAFQVLDLRVRSERLHLRDLDMQSNYLGSGLAFGPQGKMPSVHRSSADRALVSSRSHVMQECRDKLAGAVAALVSNVDLVESSSSAHLRRAYGNAAGEQVARAATPGNCPGSPMRSGTAATAAVHVARAKQQGEMLAIKPPASPRKAASSPRKKVSLETAESPRKQAST